MVKVLLVDDDPEILEVLRNTLQLRNFHCLLAHSGTEALAALGKEDIDLVLTDINMPTMNGIELLREVSQRWPSVLRMIMTGRADLETTIKAINSGQIHAYFTKPWDTSLLLEKISTMLKEKHSREKDEKDTAKYIDLVRLERQQAMNILNSFTELANDAVIMLDDNGKTTYWNDTAEEIFGYQRDEILGEDFHEKISPHSSRDQVGASLELLRRSGQCPWVNKRSELKARHKDGSEIPVELTLRSLEMNGKWMALGIIRDLTERHRAENEKQQSFEKFQRSLIQTIRAIGLTVEKRDPYTAGHQSRVALLATSIANKMTLPEEQVKGIELGATIHDIGKIYIPAEILNRPGQLSYAEFEMIKTHAEVGYDIVREIEFPWPVAEMIRQHHERLDGSGYPGGLQGDAIILEAQIIAVADVVEAISSHRPYRPALSINIGLEEIENHKSSKYNPAVADACLQVFKEDNFTFPVNIY